MNDDNVTVEPPMNDNMGPKFGIDWATNKTDNNTDVLIMTLFRLNSFLIRIRKI